MIEIQHATGETGYLNGATIERVAKGDGMVAVFLSSGAQLCFGDTLAEVIAAQENNSGVLKEYTPPVEG